MRFREGKMLTNVKELKENSPVPPPPPAPRPKEVLHDDLRALEGWLRDKAAREPSVAEQHMLREAAAALSTPTGEAVAWLEPETLNSARPDDYARVMQTHPADYADWFPVYRTPQPAPTTPASGGGKADAVALVEQTAPEGLFARFTGTGDMYAVQPGTLLYTTTPAAIHVDALRELAEKWQLSAQTHVNADHASAFHSCADELAALIAPASIGAEAQEGK